MVAASLLIDCSLDGNLKQRAMARRGAAHHSVAAIAPVALRNLRGHRESAHQRRLLSAPAVQYFHFALRKFTLAKPALEQVRHDQN
jgi:hypothetical protein